MSVFLRNGARALQIATPATPSAGQRLLYPKTDGWYEKDSAGVESKVGPGIGLTDVTSLPAATSLADTDTLLGANGGALKEFDLNQLTAYFEQRGRQNNASVASQSPTGGTDTYVVGSNITIPIGRLQAKSRYRLRIWLDKTAAAGTASIVTTVRIGTGGTVTDSSKAPLTYGAGTAATDEGVIDVDCTFRSVGAGTAAILQSNGILDHKLASTGLTNANSSIQKATSSGFDSTVANLIIGCSINTGTGATITLSHVTAELFNLA